MEDIEPMRLRRAQIEKAVCKKAAKNRLLPFVDKVFSAED
jgi:hypothetical protein